MGRDPPNHRAGDQANLSLAKGTEKPETVPRAKKDFAGMNADKASLSFFFT